MAIAATMPGLCSAGEDRVRPGEQIVPFEDGWAHVSCASRTAAPCPVCFTVPSLTGLCMCDEGGAR